jgi:hypothetical protein
MVCRFNPGLFVARMREVRGLGFANAPHAPANGVPTVPMIVPFVDHRYGRSAILDEPAVALSLYELVNLATGSSHVTSRAELADRFRIPDGATVIVSGVDKDDAIERWWELKDRPAILKTLKALGVALVTTPNYSVLTDVPRTDNLHAMKRILLAWAEMAQAGLPAALHVNGRTTELRRVLLGRAAKLERLGLADPVGPACWTLKPGLDQTLRQLGIRGDIVQDHASGHER